MKVSIRKISELTGFSPATVSNALNHKRGVNKETSDKILQVAQELGYRTEEKIKKIRFVIFRRNGKIIDDSPFYPAVIEGVERQARRLGYETVFCRLDIRDAEYEQQIDEILADTESAIVLLGTEMLEEDLMAFVSADNRIILLDGWSDIHAFDSVLISNTDSVARAMEYLVQKGHREIGYIQGDFRVQDFRYREIGYRRIMEQHGLEVRLEYIATVGTRIESAYAGMKEYLQNNPKLPTAFVADNDIIAIGAMRALKEEGYKIPDDVSIIGLDNIAFGAVSDPPLTTVGVYKHEMGEVAVRELAMSMDNPRKAKIKLQVGTSFVERGSVKER